MYLFHEHFNVRLYYGLFWRAGLIRGRRFLEGGAYFDIGVNGAARITGRFDPALVKENELTHEHT